MFAAARAPPRAAGVGPVCRAPRDRRARATRAARRTCWPPRIARSSKLSRGMPTPSAAENMLMLRPRYAGALVANTHARPAPMAPNRGPGAGKCTTVFTTTDEANSGAAELRRAIMEGQSMAR